jgi:iron-sulfur cluster assembly protein
MTDLNLVEVTPSIETQDINVLPGAVAKLREILTARNLADHGLRVFVSGGGCSGMQYGMAIEKEPSEFDTIVEQDGIKVFVDPTSMMYLSGATIDYVDNLMGGGFRIDNPNAVSSCGCGHSFRTSGQQAPAASAGGGCGCH